jgi:hypothetical protein
LPTRNRPQSRATRVDRRAAIEINVPNLNVEELAAYATAKSQAGVLDEEILREITQMLREDG